MRTFVVSMAVAGSISLGQTVAVPAATVNKITPGKGKVGNTAVVHGSGFSGGVVTVKFGRSLAHDVVVPGGADRLIRLKVPLRDALDPNPVNVTVLVNGVPAEGATLTFEYNPAGLQPVINSIDPSVVPPNVPFSVTVLGDNFTTNTGRAPSQVYLIQSDFVQQGFLSGGHTGSAFSANFQPIGPLGFYELVVGFSDGSGASLYGFQVR
jgi:hypothetical protein